MGQHGEEAILSGGSAEVVIHGGVGGAVSGNDDAAGEPDGESGGDGGVGWLERVIPLCPYVPNPLIDNFRMDYQEPLPGALFETYVAHNLFAIIDTRWKEAQLYFWGIQGRNEVDFIIEVGRNCLAMEVKSSARWQKKDLSGLEAFLAATPATINRTVFHKSGA